MVRAVENQDDFSDVGRFPNNFNNICFASLLDNDVEVEISTEHEVLRDKLVKHLDVLYLNDKLRWLRI